MKFFNLNQSLEEIIQTENTEIFRLISEVEMSGSSDILVIENKMIFIGLLSQKKNLKGKNFKG